MNGDSNRKTQRDRILRLLIEARGGWVPLPDILALGCAQYNARIFELRRLNFSIENRSEIDAETGARHSWFRLRNISEQAVAAEHPTSRFEQTHQRDLEREAPLFTGGRQ